MQYGSTRRTLITNTLVCPHSLTNIRCFVAHIPLVKAFLKFENSRCLVSMPMAITSNPIFRYQLRKSGMFGEDPFRLCSAQRGRIGNCNLCSALDFGHERKAMYGLIPRMCHLDKVARCFTRLQNIMHGRSRRTKWERQTASSPRICRHASSAPHVLLGTPETKRVLPEGVSQQGIATTATDTTSFWVQSTSSTCRLFPKSER